MMSMNITIQLFTSLSIVLLLLGGLSENRVSTVQLAPVQLPRYSLSAIES